MKHAWSATRPLPCLVNRHRLRSRGDSADVFPRLLQLELAPSTSLTPHSALFSVNWGALNTVWLHHRGQNTACIIFCVSSIALVNIWPQRKNREVVLGLFFLSNLHPFHFLLWSSWSWTFEPFIYLLLVAVYLGFSSHLCMIGVKTEVTVEADNFHHQSSKTLFPLTMLSFLCY